MEVVIDRWIGCRGVDGERKVELGGGRVFVGKADRERVIDLGRYG